ncbi:diiron oxygenase [Streptomyces avermitilis]|uniref:diiron oxygenase n=1 Tax=Streptomyces avermitilis TaxID=33903 RepID=UPI0033CB8AE3
MSVSTVWDSEMAAAVERLARASVDDYYNPYQKFEWPDAIPQDAMWMSPHLLTVHGTAEADGLTSEQLRELSRWESIHFYSLNVHGIRELLLEVVQRIHTPGFEVPTPFFHHFLGEENEHMWFFAEFCLRYGKKAVRRPLAPVPPGRHVSARRQLPGFQQDPHLRADC